MHKASVLAAIASLVLAAPPALSLVIGTLVIGASVIGAPVSPRLQLRAERRLAPVFKQGIARVPGGWVVSGTNVLARLDGSLTPTRTVTPAIPPEWAARGYDHVGDIDVVGDDVYAPLEQPNYDLGRQATARFDARTLRFVGAVELPQHENSFVTVDPHTATAYTMDHFGGDRLLRYDVRRSWRPLRPLVMDRSLERVQGGDVASGAVWLSTDDARHGVYRVDLRSGQVDELGSSGHAGGEGEGIDATPVGSARLHVLTVDEHLVPVWLDHFAVVGPTSAGKAGAPDAGWPPVLVVAVVIAAVAAVAAAAVVFRRARRHRCAHG